MFMSNWHDLTFIFQNFNPHTVRCLDERLIGSIVGSRQYRHSSSLPSGSLFLEIVDDESYVVHNGSDGTTCRWRSIGQVQIDACTRENNGLASRGGNASHCNED